MWYRIALLALTAPAFLGAAQFAQADENQDPKWVQLFNGKDLTGWKAHPDDTQCKWEVKDGSIVGTGGAGNLFSERADFENFHAKLEAKINDKGNSGLYFRSKYSKAFPDGYEAQINASDPTSKILTGSLFPTGRDKYSDDERKKMLVLEPLVKPDVWFTEEVIANGNHLVIKVNGKSAVDFVDEKNRHAKGCFAIQHQKLPKDGGPGTIVWVRKIEVQELPATKSAPQVIRITLPMLEAIMTKLGLDDALKEKLRALQKDFDKKFSAMSSTLGIWGAYHVEDLVLQKMLTDQQRQKHAEVLSALRARDVPVLAKALALSDEQKQALAKLRAAYEPKFTKLVLPTQSGERGSDKERMATHVLVVAMRADFLKAVNAELTEAQRDQLPAVLKKYPGLPGMIPESDSLAYVLLAATLAHYSQPEYIDSLATALDLSAPQKEEFRKVGAGLGAKLLASRATVAAANSVLAQQQREAMEKMLPTDELRTRWREVLKAESKGK